MIDPDALRNLAEDLRAHADEAAREACERGESLRQHVEDPLDAVLVREARDQALGEMRALGWVRRKLLALVGDLPPDAGEELLHPAPESPSRFADPVVTKTVGTCGHAIHQDVAWEPGERIIAVRHLCPLCERHRS